MYDFSYGLQTIGMTLLHLTWLMALIGFLHRLLHGLLASSPQRQYQLGLVVLLALTLAMPTATVLSVNFQNGKSKSANDSIQLSSSTETSSSPEQVAKVNLTAHSNLENSNPTGASTSPNSSSPSIQSAIASTSNQTANRSNLWPLALRIFNTVSPLVSVLYLVGFVWMLVRLLSNWRRCRRLIFNSTPIETGAIFDRLEKLCREGNSAIQPMLRLSDEILSPVLVGFLRPCILLPTSLASGLSPQQVETILLHELAHISRRDQWILLWQATLETILFFHPSMWAINHRLGECREHCCDDQVLNSGISPLEYTRVLLEVARVALERQSNSTIPDVTSLASSMTGSETLNAPDAAGSQLVRRVRRVLGVPSSKSRKIHAAASIGFRVPAILLLLSLIVGLMPSATGLFGQLDDPQEILTSRPKVVFIVFDSDGNPVEDVNCEVYIKPKDGGFRKPKATRGASPNEVAFDRQEFFYAPRFLRNGQATLEQAKSSSVIFSSRKLNQSAVWQFVEDQGTPPVAGPIKIQLQPCRTLSGVVVNVDNQQPVENATVLYWGRNSNFPVLYDEVDNVKTDANGKFFMSGVPTGMTAYLRVEKDGFRKTDSLGLEIADDVESDIRLEVVPSEVISKVNLPDLNNLEPLQSVTVLKQEFEKARDDFQNRINHLDDPADYQSVAAYYWPNSIYFDALKSIADANPGTQAELESLVWCCQFGGRSTTEEINTVKEVATRLFQNYSNRPEILPCVTYLITLQPDPTEACRRLVNENPSRLVQGKALQTEAQIVGTKLNLDDKLQDQFLLTGNNVMSGHRIGPEGQQIPFRVEMLEDGNRKALITEQLERLDRIIQHYGDVPYLHDRDLANWATIQKHKLINLTIGSKAQNVTGKLISGEDYKLSDHDGKFKLIFFWGSWCGPCHEMLPELNRLEEKYSDKIEIIGVMSETDLEAAKSDIQKHQVKFPNIVEFENTDNRITAQPNHVQWAVNSWPTVYIIDQNNRIQFNNFVYKAGADNFLRRIEILMNLHEEMNEGN